MNLLINGNVVPTRFNYCRLVILSIKFNFAWFKLLSSCLRYEVLRLEIFISISLVRAHILNDFSALMAPITTDSSHIEYCAMRVGARPSTTWHNGGM